MPEFHLRQEATYSPTACVTCATHVGPWIDTELEMPGYGHVWICKDCARQMGRLTGLVVDLDVLESVQRKFEASEMENDGLRELLGKKSLKVSDVLDSFDKLRENHSVYEIYR